MNYQQPPHGPTQWNQPQQRPPKRPMGTAATLGLLFFGGVGTCTALGVAATHETPAQKAKIAAEAQSTAAAAETLRKALDEELHKACKVASDVPLNMPDDGDIRASCKSAVRDGLKSPSTAEFPGAFDGENKTLRTDDGCNRVFRSYVDAQNSFGAKLRSKYECVYDPRTARFSVNMDL